MWRVSMTGRHTCGMLGYTSPRQVGSGLPVSARAGEPDGIAESLEQCWSVAIAGAACRSRGADDKRLERGTPGASEGGGDTVNVLKWALVALTIIWMIELVWLYWTAQNQRTDPVRTVSGAAIFWFLAAPVAIAAPNVVDRMAAFWERLIPSGPRQSSAARVPARLLINGESFAIDQPKVRIGRYPNNEIVLDHSTVSAYHAEINERPDGRHEIVDRESRNGTRVNGALVRSQVLRNGDLITLGAVSMNYLSESSSEMAAAMAAPPRSRQQAQQQYDEDYYDDYDER
jgi:hypothetical protein